MNTAPAIAAPSLNLPETAALSLAGVWKIFGPPRKLRQALAALDQGCGDRARLQGHGVFAAVAGISLEVRRYEILAIVGASGSGKSTLVRHMNGLIRPDRGSVMVNGCGIEKLSRRQLQQLRSSQIGMVFQSTSLFPHRNVIDNVVFGLEARRMPRRGRYRIAQEWLERVDLAAWARHYPSELSGGMQQRVGLARTFATDPETLLLDEPFSALDPIIRRALQDQFTSLVRGYRKTAIFITHDFAEAVRIADRIGVMSEGRIIQLGTPHEIVMRPATAYVASFATPEIKRSLTTAADIAVRRPSVAARSAVAVPPQTGLAEIVAHLQESDDCLAVQAPGGEIEGWIDRAVLLAFFRDFSHAAAA